MKLWLSKNNEIPLREQITRQIMLAITSRDLCANQKLPSVREIALRYGVHPNTVSAAYRWLEENGWVWAKRGSGVFVREFAAEKLTDAKGDAASELDFLISDFLDAARKRGFSTKQIERRLRERFARPVAEKIVVIEPDAALRKILIAEIGAAFRLPIVEPTIAENDFWRGAVAVALSRTEAEKILPDNVPLVVLQVNSVQDAMRGKDHPQAEELVAVVSGWEKFLRWSQTMLLAAGLAGEQIVLRDTSDVGWQKGLEFCRFVIADSLTQKRLSPSLDVRVFRLVSKPSFAELESYIV
jgi:GntR family transcriptional regulator